MIVREFIPDDTDSLYRILLSSLDEAYDPSVFFYFYSQWPAGQLVACDYSGRPVGFLTSVRSGDKARIMMFAVDPSVRRQGIGQQILDRFRINCRMSGLTKITLEVRDTNIGARRFYIRNGFRETEVLKRYYQDGGDGIRMDGPTSVLC